VPYEIIESLKTIILSYLLLLGLQAIFWPQTKELFGKLPDAGWSIARIFGVLVVSLTMWTVGHLGVPINSDIGLIVVISGFLLWTTLRSRKIGLDVYMVSKDEVRVIVMAEYLFLAVFFLISFVRGYQPQLDSLEKFMDYGFINTYLRSTTLPAMDMWQAGKAINYYSFGHYFASVIIRFLNVSPAVGYNLVLGFIGGVVASLTMVLVTTISEVKTRVSLIGGMLASIMMVFGGNGHSIWYLIKNGSFVGYWYADATRFIHNTIHEFPSYSLIVSDLHGHVLDLPVVLLFLVTLHYFHKFRKLTSLFVLGGLFGIMAMTNTWDVLIYGLLISIYYLYLIIKKEVSFLKALSHASIVTGTMIVVTVTWWLNFVSISSGIRLVEVRSPLWQLGVLWCLMLITVSLGWVITTKQENSLLMRSVILTVILLVIIPEIIYFKDIYPDHPRANTMFKLTYQAFVLSLVVFGVGFTQAIHSNFKNRTKALFLTVLVLVFGASMIFPLFAYPSFYDNFKEYKGLNGESWLNKSKPEKSIMLEFLRNSDIDGNMVEAVGDSYTHKNLFSAYTGIPTIQGWRVHEWLWRGSYNIVAERESEVREIYEGDDLLITMELLKKYDVKLIVVGSDEGEMYLINHQKLTGLGQVHRFDEDNYVVVVKD